MSKRIIIVSVATLLWSILPIGLHGASALDSDGALYKKCRALVKRDAGFAKGQKGLPRSFRPAISQCVVNGGKL